MTEGETFDWVRLASIFGKSIRQTQRQVSSKEFVLWQAYWEIVDQELTLDRLYLAQIAAEIRRSCVKDPARVKVSDFVYTTQKPKPAQKMNKETFTAVSKAKWMAVVGLVGAKGKKDVTRPRKHHSTPST